MKYLSGLKTANLTWLSHTSSAWSLRSVETTRAPGTRSKSTAAPKVKASTTQSTTESSKLPTKVRRKNVSSRNEIAKLSSSTPHATDLIKKIKALPGRHKTGLDLKRINIVSEALCQDVINRLRPSLLKHEGCDIIDLNPGIGLFSSKLHDVLKPRSHLLMEPDSEFYTTFLQKHMRKGSRYQIVSKSGLVWSNLQDIHTSGHLPHQVPLPVGDPGLQKPNDTLLLIANLGNYPARPYFGFPSITGMVLHQLVSASRTSSIIHSYGKVRMLVWLLDSEKKQMLPRMSSDRRKSTVEAEITCEHISEVAGSADHVSNARREYALDLTGAVEVRDRMRQHDTKTPSNRIGTLEASAADLSLEDISNLNFSKEKAWRTEWQALENQLARGEIKRTPGAKDQQSPEIQRLYALRLRKNAEKSKASRYSARLARYDELMASYRALLAHEIDAKQSRERRDEIVRAIEAWFDEVEAGPREAYTEIVQILSDRSVFRQKPPVLFWDRRMSEPLVVQPDEFYPQVEMCLLDIQPKATWEQFRGSKASDYDFLEFILTGLFISPTHSIAKALKGIAPGAIDWIEPRCPSFTDLENGGSVDMDHVFPRMMNEKMLQELYEAWMSWPFRPSKQTLMGRMGSEGVDNDAEDEHFIFRDT